MTHQCHQQVNHHSQSQLILSNTAKTIDFIQYHLNSSQTISKYMLCAKRFSLFIISYCRTICILQTQMQQFGNFWIQYDMKNDAFEAFQEIKQILSSLNQHYFQQILEYRGNGCYQYLSKKFINRNKQKLQKQIQLSLNHLNIKNEQNLRTGLYPQFWPSMQNIIDAIIKLQIKVQYIIEKVFDNNNLYVEFCALVYYSVQKFWDPIFKDQQSASIYFEISEKIILHKRLELIVKYRADLIANLKNENRFICCFSEQLVSLMKQRLNPQNYYIKYMHKKITLKEVKHLKQKYGSHEQNCIKKEIQGNVL